MLSAVSLAFVALLASAGPPKLPPLPGERAPQSEAPAEPAPDSKAPPAQAPTAKAKAIAPRTPAPLEPAAKTQPTAAPTSPGVPPDAMPAPRATPVEPGRPAVVEPPQPASNGPAPEPPETDAPDDTRNNGRSSRGRGLAPPMGAELLPGDEPEPRMLRMPPPRRPPYTGIGMFVGAGITFSIAIAEQIVGHVLVKRRCIEPFAEQANSMDDARTQANDYGDALIQCAPGILPAVALRVHSDIGLFATIGLVSAGAALRAQRQAYDDVYANRAPNAMLGLRAGGATMVGLGVVTWLSTGAASWGLLASCRDAKCATRARLMAFTTRDAGAVLIAAGSGMLAYSMSHRRGYDRYFRERAMSLGATMLPGGAGLSLRGRF